MLGDSILLDVLLRLDLRRRIILEKKRDSTDRLMEGFLIAKKMKNLITDTKLEIACFLFKEFLFWGYGICLKTDDSKMKGNQFTLTPDQTVHSITKSLRRFGRFR